MSFVPYRKSEKRPKRRDLDQGRVVAAALALLDEVGLDELTMRRLAERLGVQAASLYRHVRNKDDLLALLADEISGEIPLTPATGTWQERLTAGAYSVRRGLHAHRDAARVVAVTAPFGPRRLRHIEAILALLREAGFSPKDAARAAYHCNNFVTEFVADETRFLGLKGGSRAARKMLDDARRYLGGLPRDEFPTIVALADDLLDSDQEGLFRFGLEAWLLGLEAQLRRSRKRPPARSRDRPRRAPG